MRLRVDDTLFGITKEITDKDVYLTVNLSTYAWLSNMYVAKESLKENPLTGNGLGTHESAYDRHLPHHMRDYFTFNREDANSMLLRLMSGA